MKKIFLIMFSIILLFPSMLLAGRIGDFGVYEKETAEEEQKKWDQLVHIPEWNEAQKTECVQKLINETLQASKEFSDLSVKIENVQYNWRPVWDFYNFITIDKAGNVMVGYM